MIAALLLAGVPAALLASSPPNAAPPPPDKAYAIINACDGRAITAAPDAEPALAALGDSLDQRLILRKRDGAWSLEAVRSRVFLAASPGSVRLTPEPTNLQITPRPDGRYFIQTPSGAELSALLGSPCAGGWRIEQFPVVVPTQRVVWVDAAAAGSEADGSAERPYATLQAAVDRSQAGDMIRVRPGVYRDRVFIPKPRGGRPDAWLVLVSDVPHAAVLAPRSEHSVIHIEGASYVEVNGFAATNPAEGNCLYAARGDHHRFVGNYVYECGGGGVSTNGTDHAHFEGNVAVATSKRSIWQTSGLSVFQPRAAQLPPGAKPELRNVVRRNVAFLNDNLTLKPKEKVVTDGNGIILDDFHNKQLGSKSPPYPHKTLVEHNLVFGNGGAGIRALLADHITVQYNTSYHNDRVSKPRGPGRSEIGAVLSGDLVWRGNIVVGRPARGPNHVIFQFGSGAVEYTGNVFYEPRPGRPIAELQSGAVGPDARQNVIGREPVFTRAVLDETADFTLVALEGSDTAPPELGARPELLPSLARPEGLKNLK